MFMASTKIQKGMVFLKGGPTSLGVDPADDHPASPLRPVKRPKPWTDQSALAPSEEPEFWDESCRNPSIVKMDEQKHLSSLKTHAGNLSADSTCKRVKVTLDNNSMWKDFFSCGTEMIVTKQGNRMFPYCRFRITGLKPSKNYCLLMDIHPLDGSQHKWNDNSWQACRKAERCRKSKPFVHPESLATGEHWMQSPVSFYRLKLTNNISDQEEKIIVHPMHRYIPRLHVVQTDKAPEEVRLNGPNVLTFTFPQTEFMAVTAYQNPQLAQLKVNYNPFAKGLKEEGSISWNLKVKNNSSKVLNTERGNAIAEQHPVKKSLKSLLANHKPRCLKTVDPKPTDPPALQRNSTAYKDQSTVKDAAESPRSRPTQKLFSELIRDAHVSLQRCNMDDLNTSDHTSSGITQTHTTAKRAGGGPAIRQRDGFSVKAPQRKTEAFKKRKAKDEKLLFNSSCNKDGVRTKGSEGGTSPIGSQNSSESVDLVCISDTSETVRNPKRPARLPLPALALFLKQHSTKLKKTTSKSDTSLAEPASESRGSDAVSEQTGPELITKSCSLARVEEANSPERGGKTHQKSSIPSTDSSSGTEPEQLNSLGLLYEPLIPDVTPVLPTSSLRTPTPPLSTCTTSSSILNEVLPSQNSPPTSTLPPEPHPLKTDSTLPDPECSSFDFEPLSPASSPEPLPSLPASLALELDSTASEAAFPSEPSDDLVPNRSSVFKWHTVLPPSEQFVETPFSTFQPAVGPAAPLLPCHTEPQDLNSPPSLPSSEPPPSFQDCELPFPAELSPLALQLPLSPTFSLDGERLSPTPSLTDLVHFFSADVDAGIGATSPNSEPAVPISLPPMAETHDLILPAPPESVQKCRRRKKKGKPHETNEDQKTEECSRMQPNMEEVEEQLFISFTSKEALRLHVPDTPHSETTAESREPAEERKENSDVDALQEKIATYQQTLLRDLKLMKHRQVIHPVLQEVGLKMSLLDPALSVDLQYLGVRLPIPPPGVSLASLTQNLPSTSDVPAGFMSRTGKTTDVTQIKGWREKFTTSEVEPSPASSKPEAGPSPDLQKKNLSAFCSDMLDEYLENEGKLIDERAASFSQPPADTPVFELPMRGTSYVRTMDHILKVPSAGLPASDLVSGFIPPSKRPRLKEKKTTKMVNRKRLGPKKNKPKLSLGAGKTSESTSPTQPVLPTSEPPPENTQPPVHPPIKKRRKLKPKTSSQTLSAAESAALLPPLSRDLAPLESDSELGPDCSPTKDVIKKPSRTVTTRALLRQRDLEDSVVREGRYRTSITEERAAIALSSLFTQTGFVRENPTAPIQLPQRQKPSCLNEFCRLGCICGSLTRTARVSHCGRFDCMFGCSCLKQKVVLLKNLENSDSSASSLHGGMKKKKKKRKRRMKMAYVLKDSESVFQPAERVQNLWKKGAADVDLEPVSAPRTSSFCYKAKRSSSPTRWKNPSSQPTSEPFPVKRSQVKRRYRCSCARIRVYTRKQKTPDDENVSKNNSAQLKGLMKGSETVRMKRSHRHSDGSSPTQPSDCSEAELEPKPSKRLFIHKTCEWRSKADQNFVLKKLSKAVAQDELSQPFWVRKYLISPTDQTVQGTGADQCIHYRVRITAPKREKRKQAEQASERNSQRKNDLQRENPVKINQAEVKAEPVEEYLKKGRMAEHSEDQKKPEKFRQKMKEGELSEDWETMGAGPNFYKEEPVEDVKETELPEDWQKKGAGHMENGQVQRLKPSEVKEEEEEPLKEGAGHVEDWEEEDTEEEEEDDFTGFSDNEEEASEEQKTGCIPFPFQTKRSTDGVLSASLRQPGGKDQLVQVNGKDFKLAKIELGRMGALHPANRLAAYLTGRATSTQRRRAFLLRCTRPQDAVGPAPSVLPATTSQPHPPAGPPLQKSVTPTASKAPQVVFLQVPSPRKAAPLLAVAPQAPGSSPNQQRMILHPVQSLSGVKLYRKPDGKLVQLVPVCHKKTTPPKVPAQGVVPFPSLNPSALTIISDPNAAGTSSPGPSSAGPSSAGPSSAGPSSAGPSSAGPSSAGPSSTGPSSAGPSSAGPSSAGPSSASPPSASFPSVVPLSQKPQILRGQRMIKIPLSSLKKDPVVLTIKAQPPPPVLLNQKSIKPPPGQEVKPSVSIRPITGVPRGSIGVQPQPAAPPQPETPTCPPSAPPPAVPSHQQELARHPTDLDIVCVDEETGVYFRKSQQVKVVDLSSATDDSSDLRESGSEDEGGFRRDRHNQQERDRRGQMQQMFGALRREVGTSQHKLSKIGTLKRALEEIQELKSAETLLRRKKIRLKRRRDQFLSILVPSAENHSDLSLKGAQDLSNKSVPVSSETEENSDPEGFAATFIRDSHGDMKEAKSQSNAPRVTGLSDTPVLKEKVLELLLSNQDKLSAGGGASAPAGHANSRILNTPSHLKPVLTPIWADTHQAAVLAPPLTPQQKTIPIILAHSKARPPSANRNPAALQGPPSSHIPPLLLKTSPGALQPTPIPVAMAPVAMAPMAMAPVALAPVALASVVLTPVPSAAVNSTAVIFPILTNQEAMPCSRPRPSTDYGCRIITQEGPQPLTLHTQTDLASAPHLPGVSRLSSSDQSNLGDSSGRPHGSAQNPDPQPPAPDSDGLSSLLDEIVFLNQQYGAYASSAGTSSRRRQTTHAHCSLALILFYEQKWRKKMARSWSDKARSFPGLFRREGKGKRRFAPYANRQKSFFVTFFLLDKQRFKTLKGDEELALTLAGLGKRSLTVSESTTHSELTELLIKAYPKLGSICGGWLLHKSTGGGGQRKLVVIPPDSDGYNGQQLKGVSGSGKCTLYIAPLQEQIDTTPLPPEAKEFESMPKALCTTCGKMIPLLVLPPHIKNCKEENQCSSSEESRNQDHIFPSCHEDVTETTAQCPVCSGSFNVDIIESHASECGLRTSHAASETSSKNSDLSFKCMEEILSWIGDQVKEDDTFSICVSRSDLFNRGMQQWQRQRKSSPKNKLKVSFFGETGLDTGALTKEFLTEMVAEIEKRLFMGGMDKNGKNPRYCINHLDQNYFRSAGEILAASVAQGGPLPNFMRDWCYRYLCSGDPDTIQVSISDVTDSELSQLIMEVNASTDENIKDKTDDIISCGYVGTVSVDKKDLIIRAIVLHSTMRVLPMLDQLRKGLHLFNLVQLMERNPELCQPMFVPGNVDRVDAAFVLEKCQPDFCDKNSVKFAREVHVMNFFQDFLQEIEDCEMDGQSDDDSQQLSVAKVMQWMTGQGHKPVLPSEKKDFVIFVKFLHGCGEDHTTCYPTVSACSRTITFPVAHLTTYKEFKNIMETAICHGQGFYRI